MTRDYLQSVCGEIVTAEKGVATMCLLTDCGFSIMIFTKYVNLVGNAFKTTIIIIIFNNILANGFQTTLIITLILKKNRKENKA